MQIKAVPLHCVAEKAAALIELFVYGILQVSQSENREILKEQLSLLTSFHFPFEDKIFGLVDQSVLGG